MTTYYVGSGGNDGNAGTSWILRKLTLGYMFPCTPFNYLPYGGRIDSVLYSKFSQAGSIVVRLSNRNNVLLSEAHIGIADTSIIRMALASLRKLVVRISFICAKPQVLRIATSRIIATMAHNLILWNGAIRQLIHESMRRSLSTHISDDAISKRCMRAVPRPAFIITTSFDSCPQTLFSGYRPSISRLVPDKKSVRLSGGVSHALVGCWGYVGALSTSALAKSFWNHGVLHVSIIREFAGVCKWQPSM